MFLLSFQLEVTHKCNHKEPTSNLNDEARRIHMYSSTNPWASEREPRYPSYLQNPMRTNLPQPRSQSAPTPMTS